MVRRIRVETVEYMTVGVLALAGHLTRAEYVLLVVGILTVALEAQVELFRDG